MGMQVGDRSGGPMADINVTPLVDVVLVLLIIFMVITPMLVSGADVKLPMAVEGEKVKDDGQHLIVSIDETKQIYVGKKPVTLETLVDEMLVIMDQEDAKNTKKKDMTKVPASRHMLILIKGDQALVWQEVHEVMEEIKTKLSRPDLILASDDPRAH
jgi:biopolymer transport protein ExbD